MVRFFKIVQIVVTALNFSIVKIYAQEQLNIHPYFIHHMVDDGLPSNQVYASVQDSRGYIWFATDRGLSIFDGHKFINFSTANGLVDNTIFKFEKQGDTIWHSTISGDGEIGYFIGDKFYAFKYNDKLGVIDKKCYI